MLVVILIVAVALLVGFGSVWWKDRNRTHEQAKDGGRMDP
jgi:hypothetical protein